MSVDSPTPESLDDTLVERLKSGNSHSGNKKSHTNDQSISTLSLVTIYNEKGFEY